MNHEAYDKNHLGQVFDDYYDKVYAFLYFKVRHTSLAEDPASETFLRVAEKFKTYNPEKGALSTWIFTIALNKLRSHYRILKVKGSNSLEDMEAGLTRIRKCCCLHWRNLTAKNKQDHNFLGGEETYGTANRAAKGTASRAAKGTEAVQAG